MPLSTADKERLLVKQAQVLKLDRQCANDPHLFFQTFLFTFDPKRPPYHFPFDPFPFQHTLIDDLVRAIEQGYDIFVDKTREMGVTYTVLGVLLFYWKYRDAANFLVGSRKEDIVDNVGKVSSGEVSNKEESLFGKMDYMLERIPAIALPTGFDPQRHRSYMSLRNPELGNVIGGESANPNFSRGGRQKAILADEFAFWDNDTAAWGSTADTTNCRIVVTTPGIRPNTKAKRLRFGKDGEAIKIISLPYHLDPRKDAKWLADQRNRRSVEDFAREIMIDWEGSIAGVVYPEAKERQVGRFPYEPGWGLYYAWDFGLDGLALQVWQYNPTNGRMRMVDAIMNDNVPIQWFFPLLGKPIDSHFNYNAEQLDTVARFKQLGKGIHYGDPDVKKRSVASKEMRSVALELGDIGIYVQTNPGSNEFTERREKTKVLLQKGTEINETPGTAVWMEAIDQARYPQRTDTSQATSAIASPIHDWTSHHRTATEYLAVNFEPPTDDVVDYDDTPFDDEGFLR
jgi:hypothetical protein